MKKLLLATLLSLTVSTTASASNYVMCHFNSFTAQASQNPVAVTSSNQITIVNDSNVTKSYDFTYQILIDKYIVHTENYSVNVLSHQYFQDNKTIQTVRKFTNKGNHNASCALTIMGAEKNRIDGGGSIIIV